MPISTERKLSQSTKTRMVDLKELMVNCSIGNCRNVSRNISRQRIAPSERI
jgi:hypothetical protein